MEKEQANATFASILVDENYVFSIGACACACARSRVCVNCCTLRCLFCFLFSYPLLLLNYLNIIFGLNLSRVFL